MKKYLKLYKNGKFYNAFGDDGISKKYNEVLKIALSKYDMEKRVNRIIEKIDNYSIEELEDKFINE